VPYRIKRYDEIIRDPKDTIIFERQKSEAILAKAEATGSDGKLVHNLKGEIQHATFVEKILVSLLTKLSNFIPGAGIWLTTQRPEWNDANNALVGNGASMVTLYQMRRYVEFMLKILQQSPDNNFTISNEVKEYFSTVSNNFKNFGHPSVEGFSNSLRREFTDLNGQAASHYRDKIYKGFSGEFDVVEKNELIEFLNTILPVIDQSIKEAKREDGLYHSYNLVKHTGNEIIITHLPLMLEGQVNLIAANILNAGEIVSLLETMYAGPLYRPDQDSFMLYPFRELPSFAEKNIIPQELAEGSPFLMNLIASGDERIVKKDLEGNFHFNATFINGRILKEKLESLPDCPQTEKERILQIYESVFQHSFFTGRSGSFYKYEGLGSIYWHMVSKLLLAVGESIMLHEEKFEAHVFLPRLKELYYRIREGIGAHKQPSVYGAFPSDPYSHTPLMMGAQQPGLTGQVKEDILSRFNELGIRIENGGIRINTRMLSDKDFNENGELSFGFCNTLFVFKKAESKGMTIYYNSGEELNVKGFVFPKEVSSMIFGRKGNIKQVLVEV
jgi:hypothetical protein